MARLGRSCSQLASVVIVAIPLAGCATHAAERTTPPATAKASADAFPRRLSAGVASPKPPAALTGTLPSRGDVEGEVETLLASTQGAIDELRALRSMRFVGMDEGAVPPFELSVAGGGTLSSKSLVGRRPFVVAFFATWCKYCGAKLASLQRAFEHTGSMQVVPVSVDGPETWDSVPGYLRAFGVSEPAVRATDEPQFAFSYNPFSTIPLLVIVGKNGGLVDYQLGHEPKHEQRLPDSLRLAQTIRPLAETKSATPSP